MDCEKPEKLLNFQNVSIHFNKNMPKSKIHPNWFPDAKVYSDGKPIAQIASTKEQLQVDVWLANHPFYSDSLTVVDTEGRVERFMKKYGLNLSEE